MAKKDLFMTVQECAEKLGLAPQTIRIGIQQGAFPFGNYVKAPGNVNGSYYIPRNKVEDYLGIKKADAQTADQ